MGLFSRKSTAKVSTDGNSSNSSTAVQSPRSIKTPGANASFGSLPLPSVALPKAPDPNVDPAAYLRSIFAVRERTRLIYQRARRNQLTHFNVDMTKFVETAGYVVSIVKRDYAPDYHTIPPHGRWQHFEVGGRPRVDQLLALWPLSVDNQERTRRLIDLFLLSVLLDAGAGTQWSYKSKETGKMYRRSEGLAVASLEMFKTGMFSSDPEQPHQVDGAALRQITVDQLAKGLQITGSNPLQGLDGRAGLLQRLGEALGNREYFGLNGRPGNMLGSLGMSPSPWSLLTVPDFLMSHHATLASSVPIIPITTLWEVLMEGLSPIWPASRARIGGISLGDAWTCSSMPSDPQANRPWESVVPFHKLTQWLAYSLMTPMTKLLHVHFAGADLLTGLPEYRNGGLLIDTGLLTLKEVDMARGLTAYKNNAAVKGQPSMEVVPLFQTGDDVVVEWRAVTVGFLDALLEEVNGQLGLEKKDGLTLAQMLEAGTWKVSLSWLGLDFPRFS